MADEARDTGLLRVLLVEDEDSLRIPLARYLERECSYEVMQAAHAKEARRLLSRARRPFDVALVDDLLTPSAKKEPEYLGITLLREIKDRWPETEIIIFTGWGMERALEALQAGAYRYLEKPVNPEELGLTIRMAAEQARLRKERDLLSAALEISNAMVSAANATKALEVIAEAIPQLTGSHACAVALIDPLTGKIRHEPVILLGDESLIWTRHLRHGFLTRQIAETGKPYAVTDTDTRAEELDENLCKSGVKSFIGVPIPAEARNLGALYAYSLRPNGFGLHEEQVLTLLAQQAGIALENARLFDTTRRASEQLSALNQVVLEIGKELDQPTLLRSVIEQAIRLLSAQGGAVYLLDPTGEHVVLATAAGLPLDLEGQRIGRNEGLTGEILGTCEPQKVADYYCWEKRLRILDEHRLTGVAGAPIRVGDQILGTLIVHDTRPEKKFDDTALTLLQQFGNHVGLALQKVALLEKLRVVQQMSTTITSVLDLPEVLNRTCQAAAELFGVDHSGLVLFDQNLEMGTVKGEYPAELNTLGTQIPIKGVLAEERLAFEEETLVFPDVEEAASELGPVLDILRHFDIRSILVVPITYQGRALGSFSLDAVDQARQFTEEEVELCKILAAQVAVAVENARLHADVEQKAERLQRLLETSTTVAAAQDLDQGLQILAEKMVTSLVTTFCRILLLEDDRQHLTVRADCSIAGTQRLIWNPGKGTRYRLADVPGIARVLETRERQVFRQGDAEGQEVLARIQREVELDREIGSALIIPLEAGGEILGVCTLCEMRNWQRSPFSEDQVDFACSIAAQAAGLIARIHLYEIVCRKLDELEHMRKATEVMAGALDLPEVLQRIVESARQMLQADSSAIWSYDSVRNQFIPEELVVYGIPRDELERFRKKRPKEGGTAHTVMERGWVGITDISDPKHNFMGPSTLELLGGIGVKSFQGMVLKVGREKLGVLYVNYNSPRGFREHDKKTLETFANYAALALKKAKLLEQVSKARDTARVVAEVSVLEDLRSTLNSIAKGTQDALHCNAVTLYTYDQIRDEFGFPPAMVGVRDTGEVLKFGLVARESVIRKILALDKAHVAEDAPSDPIMGGAFVKREEIKSSVGISLKVGDCKVGVMFVNYRSRHRFTADELTNIELFANQAAVAIRNAQLYDETTRRANALQALYEASRAVTGTLTIDELLNRIVEQVWRLAEPRGEKTHFSHLAQVDGNHIRFVAACPPETLAILQKEIDLERDEPIGITGRVVLTHQSQLVGNVLEDPDYINTDPRVHSQLSVPIRMGKQVIGVIGVEHPDYNAFSEEDQRTLESLAAQAAVAIENARLYEGQQQEAEQLALINQIAAEISSSLDLDKILQTLVNELARVIRVEQCAIAVFDERGEYADVVAEYLEEGCVPSKAVLQRVPVRDNPAIELVHRTRKPLAVKDAQHDPCMERVWDIMKQRRTQSIMIVPIFIGDELIGTIGLDAVSGSRDFTKQEQWLAQTIAHHAAIAIQNARRYEELKKTRETLAAKAAVAWMGMVSATWGHNVGNQATTIIDNIQLLHSAVAADASPERVKILLDRIETVARTIQSTVITTPLSAEEGTELVPINTFLRERVERLRSSYKEADMKWELILNLPEEAEVRIGRLWLMRVLDILVQNAIEAMKEAPQRVLTISSRALGNKAEILVSDTGKGIPLEIQDKLFKEPIPASIDSRGSGLGLLLVQTILQTYGGDIALSSSDKEGTTVVIHLPCKQA